MSITYRSSPKFCVKTVHGGLILSMTDTLGSLALATKGSYMTGVSVDIGTSFLKPAGRVGDILKARATVTGLGELVIQLHRSIIDFVQAKLWHSQRLTSRTRLEISWHTDVRISPCFTASCVINGPLADHTKFVGKTAGHPVSSFESCSLYL